MNSQKNIKDWSDWNHKFSLQEHNIPNVLDYKSALLIFNAGKTFYFLKNHCSLDYHLNLEFPNPIQKEN